VCEDITSQLREEFVNHEDLDDFRALVGDEGRRLHTIIHGLLFFDVWREYRVLEAAASVAWGRDSADFEILRKQIVKTREWKVFNGTERKKARRDIVRTFFRSV
jgi:hypothetical protein